LITASVTRAIRRRVHALVRHLSSLSKNLPPVFIFLNRRQRHEAVLSPVIRTMNMARDFAVFGYEVAYRLLSLLVAQENKDGQLVCECIRIACELHVPRCRPNGLDLQLLQNCVGGLANEDIVVLRIAISQLSIESTPQQFSHHEVLASVSRGNT
jgi:hypothetical protein